MAIPISLGSWYFTLDVGASIALRPSEFFGRVERCLSEIQGVADLEMDLMALPGEDQPVEFEPDPDPRYGLYLGPHWDFESISFSLRLPLELQADLLKPHRVVTGGEAENFRVIMTYGWLMAVSCVALLDAPCDDDTSQGALAVLRYLERETPKSPQGVRLKAVPPFFAHADVFLHPQKRETSRRWQAFWSMAYSTPAHHRYDIAFDSEATRDPVAGFLREVSSELDLYYQIVHSESVRRSGWEQIDAIVGDLTALRRAGGLRGRSRRMFQTNRLSSEATIRLMEFAAQDQVIAADFRRQSRNLYEAERGVLIKELVLSELADRETYPVEQFSRLVELVEEHRLTHREMLVLLIASLTAGALGAAATLLASG